MSILKISIRVFAEDIEYLKKHPVEDVAERRVVPYNETIRELLHSFVQELKDLRGHQK